jgi:hypothetical protein
MVFKRTRPVGRASSARSRNYRSENSEGRGVSTAAALVLRRTVRSLR